MLLGIDVSHWNALTDIRSALVNGAHFGFAKCTEGSEKWDSQYSANITLLRNARVNVGHYHKAVDALHPDAEFTNFIHHAFVKVNESVMLDLESMTGTWEQRVWYAVWWLTHVHARYNCYPFWYVNKDYLNHFLAAATADQLHVLGQYPLWIAAPSDPMGHPVISHQWVIQQYGIANNIDRDYWNPSAYTWDRYCVKPTPVAAATPTVTQPVTPPINPAPLPAPVIPTDPNAPQGEHSGGRIQDL